MKYNISIISPKTWIHHSAVNEVVLYFYFMIKKKFDVKISFNNIDIDTGTLWIQPSVSYKVDVLDGSQTDSVWDEMDSLQVSLIKPFAYSSPDSVLALGDGESYVWVVDSKFSTMPQDFSLDIGIERVFFNASAVLQDLISALGTVFHCAAFPFSSFGMAGSCISTPFSSSVARNASMLASSCLSVRLSILSAASVSLGTK